MDAGKFLPPGRRGGCRSGMRSPAAESRARAFKKCFGTDASTYFTARRVRLRVACHGHPSRIARRGNMGAVVAVVPASWAGGGHASSPARSHSAGVILRPAGHDSCGELPTRRGEATPTHPSEFTQGHGGRRDTFRRLKVLAEIAMHNYALNCITTHSQF